MKIQQIISGELGVNTYLVINEENKKAVIIDAGDYDKIKAAEAKAGVKITACLLTHGHFDHIVSCKRFQSEGVKIYVSSLDEGKLNSSGNLGEIFGESVEQLTADYTFNGGDKISLNGLTFEVIATPGHTEGSVSFVIENVIFSGDTLFYEDVGRTDLLGGDAKMMKQSIMKLFSLKGEYIVYAGHGRNTTLTHEKENNYYI